MRFETHVLRVGFETMPRWLWSLSPAIVLGVAFVTLTRFVRRSPTVPREISLDRALTARAPAGLIDLSHAVNVQVWIFVVLALVVCLLVMRRFRQALLLLLAEPLAEALNLALKVAINREMPDQGAVVGLDRLDVLLFPSGHVVRVTVSLGLFVAFLAWPKPRLRWPATLAALGFIALVGVTQTTVGGHLPLDVVGGLLLGAVLVNVVYVLDKAWAGYGFAPVPALALPAPRTILPMPMAPRTTRLLPALVLSLVVLGAIALRVPQRLWHTAASAPSLSPSGLVQVAGQRVESAHAWIGRLRGNGASG